MKPVAYWMDLTACAGCLFLMLTLGGGAAMSMPGEPAPGSAPEEPGSVVVFPKFLKPAAPVDDTTKSSTEIEVRVSCPKDHTCSDGELVKIRFHWVCPGNQDFDSMLVCKVSKFDLVTPIDSRIVFNPNALAISGNDAARVPPAQCTQGYLIGEVIDPANNQPVKFDGLTGNAVLRDGDAVLEYPAIPIRADPVLPNFPAGGSAIATGKDTVTGAPTLIFDGAPGHYQSIANLLPPGIKFDSQTAPSPLATSSLVLLALDVRSNQPNYPIFVDLTLGNDMGFLWSTSREFLCWTQLQLASPARGQAEALKVDPTGLVLSGQAAKLPFIGIADAAGPITLLGLVQISHGPGTKPIARAITLTKEPATPNAAVFVLF